MLTHAYWHDFTVLILKCKKVMNIYRDHPYGLKLYRFVSPYHLILHNSRGIVRTFIKVPFLPGTLLKVCTLLVLGPSLDYMSLHFSEPSWEVQNPYWDCQGLSSALCSSFRVYGGKGPLPSTRSDEGPLPFPESLLRSPTLPMTFMKDCTLHWILTLDCMTGKVFYLLQKGSGKNIGLPRTFVKVPCPSKDLWEGHLSFPGSSRRPPYVCILDK